MIQYSAVKTCNLLHNTYNRHPIPHPHWWGMAPHTSPSLVRYGVSFVISEYDFCTHIVAACCFGPSYNSTWPYHQTSNIRCTVVGNKIVDHSDGVGASPVGTAPITSWFSTQHLASICCTKATARWDEKFLNFRICCILHMRFDFIMPPMHVCICPQSFLTIMKLIIFPYWLSAKLWLEMSPVPDQNFDISSWLLSQMHPIRCVLLRRKTHSNDIHVNFHKNVETIAGLSQKSEVLPTLAFILNSVCNDVLFMHGL